MWVPISTLVASERQACSCDVRPDLVGPDDPLPERQPSRSPEPLRRNQALLWGVIVAPLGTQIVAFILNNVVAEGSSCGF